MNRLLIASLAVLAAALPASADTVLQKAKSMSKDGPLYAFDLSYDDGKDRFQMKVDPSQPKGKRVVDLSPARSTLKGDSAKKADKLTERTEGDIWCSSFAANIPADAKRTAETGQTATFSFTPLPGEQKGQAASAYKFLNATAVIDKATGGILSYEMAAPKAFKPAPVAKIDRLTLKVACKPLPDGRTHIDTFAFDLKGSAMMQSLDQKESRRISNLKALGTTGFGAP